MKISCLFFTFFLLVTSCKTLKIHDPKLTGIDGFDVTIEKATTDYEHSSFGGAYGPVPARGYYFITLKLKIVNNSVENNVIDFTDFALVDPEKNYIYPLSEVYPLISQIPAKSSKKIKSKASIKRKLMFSFPKGKRPKHLMYKEELIELNIS